MLVKNGVVVDSSNYDGSNEETQDLSPFGFLKKGRAERLGGSWTRNDVYTRSDGTLTVVEPAFCTGPHDRSDRAVLVYAGSGNVEYNGVKCASCYLGHTHTVALHNRNIADNPGVVNKGGYISGR